MVRGGNRLDDFKKSYMGKKLSRFDRKLTYGSKYDTEPDKFGSKKIDYNKYDLSGLEAEERFQELQKLKNPGDDAKIKKAKFDYIQSHPEVRQSYDYNGVRWKTIGVISVLSFIFIIVSILVADIYNNSSKKITEDETAQGAYTYVISSITAVLTVVVTLLIAAMATKYKLIMFMILFGIFGIATSAIGIYWIENDPDMSKTYSKDKWNFLIAAIVIWIMVILAALVSMAI
jgi:hypothetical protein